MTSSAEQRRSSLSISRVPIFPLSAVEHVALQRMAVGQGRMVKIAPWIVPHANPFHDPARWQVAWDGERHDFSQPKRPKAVGERSPSCLRSVTLAPVVAGKTPASLDGRGKRSSKRHMLQAHEAHERCSAGHLHRPEAELVRCDVLLYPHGLGIALLAGKGAWKPAAYLGVGVEGSEDGQVRLPPRTKQQPGCTEFSHAVRKKLLLPTCESPASACQSSGVANPTKRCAVNPQ